MTRTGRVVDPGEEAKDHSLKRRIFTKEFKPQILREVQVEKPTAQAAHEHRWLPNLIRAQLQAPE